MYFLKLCLNIASVHLWLENKWNFMFCEIENLILSVLNFKDIRTILLYRELLHSLNQRMKNLLHCSTRILTYQRFSHKNDSWEIYRKVFINSMLLETKRKRLSWNILYSNTRIHTSYSSHSLLFFTWLSSLFNCARNDWTE
jgi:hypothetical protein